MRASGRVRDRAGRLAGAQGLAGAGTDRLTAVKELDRAARLDRPSRAAGGATDAVNVVLEPTLTDAVASSEVVVVSGATTSPSAGLAEPFRTDPAVGVNTAVSCAVDAANDVEQATVALCPLGVTATFTQP